MHRVLLIGPNFHYFLPSIGRAFESCGYEVRVESYDNPIHPYDTCNKVRYKLSADKDSLRQLSRQRFRPYIEKQFDSFRPDLVFILNGDNLLPESIQLFSRTAKVGIWLFDSIHRIPDCGPNLPYADAVFCYEKEDISYLSEACGIRAHFLPQAVDETLYFPVTDRHYQWDIVFAGDMVHSSKRRRIMQAVVAHYPHLRIRVWGIYKLWYKGLRTWLTRERRDIYMNRSASAEQLNEDYNSARIVLNIHHEQQKNGANPKVYEISASGAYQICDNNPYIESLFPNGEVGLYETEEDLFRRIDYALSHDMSQQAEAAYRIIIADNTFRERIKQMLNLLK